MQAETIGLEGFLVKPVNPSVMFDTIMQAMAKDTTKELRPPDRKGKESELMKGLAGVRVLLVEDNEINQQVAMEILAGAGLVVSVANNGKEAVDAVGKNSYDAVLMDVQMPVMDGYTAAGIIRRDERFKDLPILAMTAHAMAGDQDKSIAAGMNDHVTKPIDPEKLFATLAKWTARKTVASVVTAAAAVTEEPTCALATETKTLQPSLEGFDLEAGLRRLQGNEALYRKLLVSFAGKYSRAASDIQQLLDDKDYEKAHRLIHDVKGLAGNLSADQLRDATGELEKLVKYANDEKPPEPEALAKNFGTFEKLLEQALSSARSLAPQTGEPGPAAPAGPAQGLPSGLAKEAAERLREAAELGDVSGVASIAGEMMLRSGDFAPYQRRIIKLADDFDFDGIIAIAAELEKTGT